MITCVKHNHTGTHLLAGSQQGTIQLWNAQTHSHVTTFTQEHARDIRALSISRDGEIFASGGDDRHVIVWDTKKGSLVSRFSDHLSHMTDVQIPTWSRDLLFSGSHDGTAKCWDLRSRARVPIQSFRSRDSVVSVAAPVAGYVVTCSSDGHVTLYDVRMGEKAVTSISSSSLSGMSISLSEPFVGAFGSRDVILCDLMSGLELERKSFDLGGSSNDSDRQKSSFRNANFFKNDSKVVASRGSTLVWYEVAGEGKGAKELKGRVTSLSVDNRKETKEVAVVEGGKITWVGVEGW